VRSGQLQSRLWTEAFNALSRLLGPRPNINTPAQNVAWLKTNTKFVLFMYYDVLLGLQMQLRIWKDGNSQGHHVLVTKRRGKLKQWPSLKPGVIKRRVENIVAPFLILEQQ